LYAFLGKKKKKKKKEKKKKIFCKTILLAVRRQSVKRECKEKKRGKRSEVRRDVYRRRLKVYLSPH